METFSPANIVIECTVFKSYYVVWKQLTCVEKASTLALFKSYYVVWKHARGERMYENPISLNRTM